MEVCSPRQLPTGKKIWKVYVAAALAFGVATVVLAVALPSVLCQQAVGSMMAGNGSARLAWLEKELDVTNLSLAEARGQWEGCRKQLRVLEGKVLELEPALVRVTQLQEENGVLRAQVAQQEKQLEDLQSSRDELQLKNQALEKQLQDMRSQHSSGNSSGNRTPAVSLSLLALLLPGMLLL